MVRLVINTISLYRKRDNLKVERRDGSKAIKKGGDGGNPRKISLGQLRREQKTNNKGGRDGGREERTERGGKRGGGKPDRGGKGGDRGGRGKRFRKGGRKEEPKTAESLDKDLENYWVKAGNKDIGKSII